MNLANKTTGRTDRKVILSTLWVFVIFNYLYWDLAPMIFDSAAKKVATGMSEGMILGFALFIESAIALVLLSRVLKYQANRWANLIAGALHAVIISWSLLAGSPRAVDIFFAGMVVACALFIVRYAWTWPNPESQPSL